MRLFFIAGAIGLSNLLLHPAAVFAEAPPKNKLRAVRQLHISPGTIQIRGDNRKQQILVTAIDQNGQKFDVTHQSEITILNPKMAQRENSAIVGVSNGTTKLRVRYAGKEVTTAVSVTRFDSFPPVHFVNDVVPLFSKLGCNSGGCHGKGSGQNGFRLSVFGSDPATDFIALSREARGRRIFPSAPESSLLVQKAIGTIAHGGGKRAIPHSEDHRLLTEWIRQGMPWGEKNAPTLSRILIEPDSRVLKIRSDQQILVTALFSDGSRRDVTRSSAYTSNAEAIAEVDQTGRIQSGNNPGESAITINYMGQVAAVKVLVPRTSVPNPYPRIPENNRIDRLVWTKLRRMGIVPSGISNDTAFLRRAYIDTIGTLPRPEEVKQFLANKRPDKRARIIDTLLNRLEYADYWSLKFADILLVNSETLGERGAYQFHRWLREQFRVNRPYDEWVREIITATGDTNINGPVNFYRALRDPVDLTKSVSQAFMGVRLDCCQCHHHPFEKWGQDDFYGLSGFFNGIQRKKLPGNRERIFHAGFQPAKMPLTGKLVPTKPPGGPVPENLDDGDPRVKLAQWITSPKNPYFARLVANRIWKNFLGRGLVEPEDDLRSTNPATNEPLLDFLVVELTGKKAAQRFDLKNLMRLILNSRVYQLSSVPNKTNADDDQNFSHFYAKRLPAEVLLDAVSQATGSPEKFPGMPRGTRTIQLWDNRMPSYFLDTFGRSERESPCECGKSNSPTIAQALHLMNAPEIEEKIADKRGRVAELIKAGKTQHELVEALCLSTLNRPAGIKEHRIAAKLFQGQPKQQAAEDFLWALLSSYDFLFVR